MYDYTKLVPEKVWQELLRILPTPRQKRFGRRRCPKEALLNGILQVLINGVAWGKIVDCGCGYASCFRYFQELQRRGKLKLIPHLLARVKTDINDGSTEDKDILPQHIKNTVGMRKKVLSLDMKYMSLQTSQGITS